MRLYNFYFLPDAGNFICYNEGSYYYAYSVFGSNKLYFCDEIYNIFHEGCVVVYLSKLLARQLNIWLRSKWRHFFKSVYTQFLSKFRIVGRGYKLYNDKNNLVFRLGYSHSIYYLLPMTMYLAKKEKSSFFWRIYGQDLEKGRSLLHYLKNFKQPNIYSSKGIFRANEWFIKKQGKKAYSV